MSDVSVQNTSSSLSGKTLLIAESPATISAVLTFSEKPIINAGLQFPATQVASTDVNTLDDYEEGTWTPTIGGTTSESGQVYSTQLGHYVKVGKFVAVTFQVGLSTLGTITGFVQIKGLPFVVDTVDWYTDIFWHQLSSSYVKLGVKTNNASSALTLLGVTAASTSSISIVLTQADLSATTDLRGSFVYRAAT